MKIVILGGGLVGMRLARLLNSEGKEIVLIEKDHEEAERASNRVDCKVIIGEGNNLNTLKKAGMENTNYFVSVSESDEINMIACSLVASEYSKPVTVARVRNLNYFDSRVVSHTLFGINHIINPEIEAARAVIQSVNQGAVNTVNLFEESNLSMTSISMDKGNPLVGQSVRNLRKTLGGDFLIPLVIRDKASLIPDGTTVVLAKDLLYVLAGSAESDGILRSFGLEKRELKTIAIAGGGRIGRYVADSLLGHNSSGHMYDYFPDNPKPKSKLWNSRHKKVQFIERDYERGRQLSLEYPHAYVMNEDISDEIITETGLLDNYDLLISATGNQELNLVSALYYRNHGVRRTLALVRKAAYVAMAREMGIDVTVSVTDTMVDSILRILRKGNIQGVHTIAGSDFELIDFLLDSHSPLVGKTVKDARLPKNSLILMIKRNDQYIIPHGSLEILTGDRLVIITSHVSIKKLEQVVTGK